MINPSIILFTLTSGNKNCYSQRGCQSGDSHWDFIIWHYCGVLWWNIPLTVEGFQWDSLIWSNPLIINKSCDESPPSFLKPKKNPQLATITFVWSIEPNYFDVKIRNCLQFKFTWNTNAILISFPPLQSNIPSQESDTVHYTDTLFQWWCPLPLKYCYLTRAMCFWLFKQKQRVTVINEKAQSDFYNRPQKHYAIGSMTSNERIYNYWSLLHTN